MDKSSRSPHPAPFAARKAEPARHDATTALEPTRGVLDKIFGPPIERSFSVRFWDGTTDAPEGDESGFVLVLRHPGALREALLPPTDHSMGEAFVGGHIDIEGDVEAAAAVAAQIRERAASAPGFLGLLRTATKLPRAPKPDANERMERTAAGWRPEGALHSRSRDTTAVRYHYDVGNRFFETFLDSRLVYSCGYFARGDETLDDAQEAKLDLICRKLRLRDGERFLDIGCGWGSLILFAAERYGVHATGVTLSARQAEVAQRRITEAGLADRCRVEIRDYRDLDGSERFAKIASVGMVEHVGHAQLSTYFKTVEQLLDPGGLFLNHGIVSLEPVGGGLRHRVQRWWARRGSFIQSSVFPDSELVSPAQVIGPGELAGLELRDVESLREHYATTLRHWVRRLEAAEDRAVREAGERTYRVWRLYMAASAHLFASGALGIIQTLWGKPHEDGYLPLPASREDLFQVSAPEPSVDAQRSRWAPGTGGVRAAPRLLS